MTNPEAAAQLRQHLEEVYNIAADETHVAIERAIEALAEVEELRAEVVNWWSALAVYVERFQAGPA